MRYQRGWHSDDEDICRFGAEGRFKLSGGNGAPDQHGQVGFDDVEVLSVSDLERFLGPGTAQAVFDSPLSAP